MGISLIKQVRDRPLLRASFMELAEEVFDLSFAHWFEMGFWTDRYLPYVLAEQDRVLANVSVNLMETTWQGTPKRCLQIGTVMTKKEFRHRGYCRRLMEEVLSDWSDRCDAIYLFANDSVLDFYPQFGFRQAQEYQYRLQVTPCQGDFVPLHMEQASDRALLLRCFQKSNSYALLPMLQNEGLLMFYCTQMMKDCVYYSAQLDMAAIAVHTDHTLLCYDLFGQAGLPLEQVVQRLCAPQTRQVLFGFTPKQLPGADCTCLQGEDTLFVLKGKENFFAHQRLMFPLLSHA